jgi:transcription elongation GreA/GreB family factor
MSQAFIKEGDGDRDEELPVRPISSLPNYVTRKGLASLESRMGELGSRRAELAKDRNDNKVMRKLKEVERDLRYFESRVETAIVVDHSESPPEEARFGAIVKVDEAGDIREYRIVGEDEADARKGFLCWASPLANALLGKKAGDSAQWDQDAGVATLKVLSVSY